MHRAATMWLECVPTLIGPTDMRIKEALFLATVTQGVYV